MDEFESYTEEDTNYYEETEQESKGSSENFDFEEIVTITKIN